VTESSSTSEASWRVWYCQACRRIARAVPELPVGCQCKRPVIPLQPTLVTEVQAPKVRPLQALTEEEGRLRALARRGTAVRVGFDSKVVDAWLTSGTDGRKRVVLVVEAPDGSRIAVDSERDGVHIEAIDDSGET
jgi:hypothetical protein